VTLAECFQPHVALSLVSQAFREDLCKANGEREQTPVSHLTTDSTRYWPVCAHCSPSVLPHCPFLSSRRGPTGTPKKALIKKSPSQELLVSHD